VAGELEGTGDSELADAVDLLRALEDADTAHALNAALGGRCPAATPASSTAA
jgi:hypothetical protein